MKPDNFGKKILVEQCPQIRLSEFVRKAKKQLRESLLHSFIEAEGYQIQLNSSLTGFGGTRYWFSCPICHKRSGVLYKHPVNQILGCRGCLRLDYRKHRYSKMLENN